jgi:type I restriction enzyme M protein
MQYVPELTWILFLRVLDDQEQASQEEAEAVGAHFTPSLRSPYRWRDWASPGGAKRKELEAGKLGDFFGFVNGDLIPYLKSLAHNPNATARQKSLARLCPASRRLASTPKRICSTCSTASTH